jgi:hypothetical protein
MTLNKKESNPTSPENEAGTTTSALDAARELGAEILHKPWVRGHQSGVMALYQTAMLEDGDENAFDHNTATKAMFDKIPERFKSRFLEQPDSLNAMYTDAKADLIATILKNQSPEVQSKIADLKITVAYAVDYLAQLGLLGEFKIDGFAEKLHNLPVYIFSIYDKKMYDAGAFYNQGEHYIGFVQDDLNSKSMMHEVAHALIEGHYNTFWNSCMSLAEATVHHIADRGISTATIDALDDGAQRKRKLGSMDVKGHFNKKKFTKYDQKSVYESDRKIMYELCEGGIAVKDFVGALVDPTPKSMGILRDRLNLSFDGMLGQEDSDVMQWINDRIDGPNAQELCKGLENRDERTEYVLSLILEFKNQRSVAQAIRSRIDARVKYRKLRSANSHGSS